MRDLINSIVFGWYPYLILAVFLLGSWLRFDREQSIWPSGSSQLLTSPATYMGRRPVWRYPGSFRR